MEQFNKVLIGKRIKERRCELKMTQAELGQLVGVAPSTIQRYESGSILRPKIPVVKAICDTLGISVPFLQKNSEIGIGNEIENMPANAFPADLSSNVRVPIVGRVAAGLACHAEQYIEGYDYASSDMIIDGEDYVYLRVKGDSMLPLLMEDDLVLVRCQNIVDSGTYAVVIIDDEDGVVKKVYHSKGRVELISENPYYPPRIFEGEECARVRIFGKVIECKRKF